MAEKHVWSFRRLGGFEQVQLQTADDLRNLEHLDAKLWTALACPTDGMYFDKKTLKLLDADQDGRVRAPEVIAAVKWCCQVLRDPGVLLKPSHELPLNALNTGTKEGQELKAAAEHLLRLLGRPEATEVSLSDVTEQQEVLKNARFNGDGIIVPQITDDAVLAELIQQIIDVMGGKEDVSGSLGIDQQGIEGFYQAIADRIEWLGQEHADWLPEGVDGRSAVALLDQVRDKIDDFFSRSRAGRFDERALKKLNPSESAWGDFQGVLSAQGEEFKHFPLAFVTAEGVLPLGQQVNPAWQQLITTFNDSVLQPVFGQLETLTEGQWQEVKDKFDAYQQWLHGEKGKQVASLSLEQLEALQTDSKQKQLEALIEEDLAAKPKVKALAQVETLLRYRLHLKELLDNFVSFVGFYSPDKRAVFEAGTLYLDSRSCDLVIEVKDQAKHAALAGLSNCFLAYCDCTRKDGATKSIVAAFTGGSQDYLMVGRNGVFYDRDGVDWDATITKIVENPISIPQAFFSPYKRFVRFLEEQAAKRAQDAEASSQASMEKGALSSVSKAEEGASDTGKFDIGVVAALGVAVGGITTAIGLFLQAIFGLGWLMPLGLVGLMLLISGPSMFIAWLKLRQRNLGPILDATGWAINGRVKINVPFGSQLTQLGQLPPGSKRSLKDPYKKSSWKKTILVVCGLMVFLAGAWFAYDKQQQAALEAQEAAQAEAATLVDTDATPESEDP